MLVIRLQRTGRENTPTYRIVVSEKTRHAKKGAHEILGHYLPSGKSKTFVCDKERSMYWISKGAIPSDTMARLLKKDGAAGMDKYIKRYAKQKSKKEPVEAPSAPAPAPAAAAPEVSTEAAPAQAV
jgi:small subunit ribosomal protein S16